MTRRIVRAHRRASLLGIVAVALSGHGLLGCAARPGGTGAAESASAPVGARPEATFRVVFGLRDTAPTAWDGRVVAAPGQDLRVEPDRFRAHNYSAKQESAAPADSMRDGTSWVASTHPAWMRGRDARPVLQAPSILVHVRANPGRAPIRIETLRGRADFDPAAVGPFQPAMLLDGAARVDRVPAPLAVAAASDGQQDFPAVAASRGGDVWISWQENRPDGDAVLVRSLSGERWGPVAELVRGADVFRTALAEDAAGRVWVFWSMQAGGNWDVYGSVRGEQGWTAPQRLTTAAGPDIHVAAAGDGRKRLWLAWQGTRDGTSRILARSFDGGRWSDEVRVSEGVPANSWWPALAGGPDGRVAIAWDSYTGGSYDVYLRVLEGERWSDTRAVAATRRFEANPAVAIGGDGRIWIAWHQAGPEWGKDAGGMIERRYGLYEPRSIRLACIDRAGMLATAGPLDDGLDAGDSWELPRLAVDAAGRPWLFARHLLMRMPDSRTAGSGTIYGSLWETYATRYDGARWGAGMVIPATSGRQDMVPEAAADAAGRVWLVSTSDGRDTRSGTSHRQGTVSIARLEDPEPRRELALGSRAPEPEPDVRVGHPDEAEDVRRIRAYRVAARGKSYAIFRGDLHRHTELSWDGAGDGTLLDAYRYARDAASLDFIGVTDHEDQVQKPYVWWLTQKYSDLFQLGNFAAFYSYERSVEFPNGHRNVFFTRRGQPVLPVLDPEARGWEGATGLFAYLRRYNGTSISHTSATGAGTDWRDADPAVEHLVEIYQGMRETAEYAGAPIPKTLRPSKTLEEDGAPHRRYGTVRSALARGLKLGFIASSDHLSTHISYACLLAEKLTLDGLMEAIRARRAYAATDNIVLDVRCTGSDGEHLMGEEFASAAPVRLAVKVQGTADVKQVDIVKDGKIVYTATPARRDVELGFTDAAGGTGQSYYYARVMQVDGEMAWGSPFWVTYGR